MMSIFSAAELGNDCLDAATALANGGAHRVEAVLAAGGRNL
jgi:hypothetical protein